ncbi:MAG: NHL repeat-containing protein [Deltaproteobacteria bacterium]|nr:NHL repeat-containing protein [Deltaproteobacteria bacterium]
MTASFNQTLVPLSVSLVGDGAGVVRTNDGEIVCPPDCSHSYPQGTSVSLSATAEASASYFEGWSGACAGSAGCSVTLDGTTSVTATLLRTRVNVSLTGAGTGRVTMMPGNLDCTASCSFPVANNANIEFTMHPEGYDRFVGWSGACSGTGDRCRVRAQRTLSISAELRHPRPPVATYAEATLVLGQPNMETAGANTGGLSASSLNGPRGCATDGTHLWVADASNSRVLQWNSEPTTNHQPADVILGQIADDVGTAHTSIAGLANPAGLSVAPDGALLVADTANSRIVRWNEPPTANGQDANAIIGNSSADTLVSGTAQNRLFRPFALTFAGARMIVADAGNNRVSIFGSTPTVTGFASAQDVLGQISFEAQTRYMYDPLNPTVPPPNAGTISDPFGVFYDSVGDRLYVADTGNHRVLVWNGIPATTRGTLTPADIILGQPNATSIEPNRGRPWSELDGTRMRSPRTALVAHGSLFVADAGNVRILVWTPPPTDAEQHPTRVLGQSSEYVKVMPSPSSRSFNPWGLCATDDFLYVIDGDQHRVLRFDLDP